MTRRLGRVNANLRQEISAILANEVKDPPRRGDGERYGGRRLPRHAQGQGVRERLRRRGTTGP